MNHVIATLESVGQPRTLGERQEFFAIALSFLIQEAYERGYRIRLGDVFRDPRSHGAMGESGPYGKRNSNHKLKCAADLNLFQDGKWLTRTEDHRELGAWWEDLGQVLGVPLRWGGRYKDGNHYEYAHGWEWEPMQVVA